MSSQNIISGQNPDPWQNKSFPYGGRAGASCSFILLIFFLMFSIPMALAGFIVEPNDRAVMPPVLMAVIALVLSVLAIWGIVKVWPYLRRPANFKPTASIVDANKMGEWFEVRHSRTFDSKGTVRFSETHLILEGKVRASVWMQLGVILVVTVIPLVLFGIGLGIIPALLIAAAIGKKDAAYHVPYKDVVDVKVKGSTVDLKVMGQEHSDFRFTVSSSDGERLYRELQSHYPKAVETGSSPILSS